MNRIILGAGLALLVAGCAIPDQPPRHKLTAAERACRDAPPPTGSHITDDANCGQDPFVKHGYITNRSGSSIMDQDHSPSPVK